MTGKDPKDFLISLNSLIEEQDAEEPNDFLPSVSKKDFSTYKTQSLVSYLQSAIFKLLHFKSNYTLSDLYDLISEIEKYETVTQDTEEKIRKRIRKQNELRVRLQELKWNEEELENKEKNYKKRTQMLEDRVSFLRIPKKFDEQKIRLDLGKRLNETEKLISGKVGRIDQVTKENQLLKEQLMAKERELRILKREKKRLGSVAHSLGCSPVSVSVDELQPSPGCSIFLTGLMKNPILTSKVRKHFDFKTMVGSPVIADHFAGKYLKPPNINNQGIKNL